MSLSNTNVHLYQLSVSGFFFFLSVDDVMCNVLSPPLQLYLRPLCDGLISKSKLEQSLQLITDPTSSLAAGLERESAFVTKQA